MNIDELETYLNGLRVDIDVAPNVICYNYDNRLIKESLIKLTRQNMYDENRVQLLKVKLLLNDYFY